MTGDDGRPGNLTDEDTQWRKLELLVTTAERIWGRTRLSLTDTNTGGVTRT
jgi:hypothetical protein